MFNLQLDSDENETNRNGSIDVKYCLYVIRITPT